MMLPFRLGCPMSLKTPNMGNTGWITLVGQVAMYIGFGLGDAGHGVVGILSASKVVSRPH